MTGSRQPTERARKPASGSTAAFYGALPRHARFEDVLSDRFYRPVPDDWWIAATDVVGSTTAIAEGRYKMVNMAGASAISALSNAFGQQQVPFVFGGDGAIAAIGPDGAGKARDALARVARWAQEELALETRAALIPVGDIRGAGRDVRIACYAPGPDVTYAMFAGGGAAWAEQQMKAGRYLIAPAAPGSRPDLAGLSCRWSPMTSARGVILSLIAVPAGAAQGFGDLSARLIALAGGDGRGSHPVPPGGPDFAWPPAGLELEARAAAAPSDRRLARWKIRGEILLAWLLFKTGMKLGRFDPGHYVETLVRNSDFRKFDDGLKMTLDCTAAVADEIEAVLEQAKRVGTCHYGLHRQSQALLTCIVPSPMSDDHIHFVDGAAGGYAKAAEMLKAQITTS